MPLRNRSSFVARKTSPFCGRGNRGFSFKQNTNKGDNSNRKKNERQTKILMKQDKTARRRKVKAEEIKQ